MADRFGFRFFVDTATGSGTIGEHPTIGFYLLVHKLMCLFLLWYKQILADIFPDNISGVTTLDDSASTKFQYKHLRWSTTLTLHFPHNVATSLLFFAQRLYFDISKEVWKVPIDTIKIHIIKIVGNKVFYKIYLVIFFSYERWFSYKMYFK